MASLDENQVRDLLFGREDPREVALDLANRSLTMDSVERDQRQTILAALGVHATQEMAAATVQLARWTRLAVWVAVGATVLSCGFSAAVLVLRA